MIHRSHGVNRVFIRADDPVIQAKDHRFADLIGDQRKPFAVTGGDINNIGIGMNIIGFEILG